jgi:oxygen-independent coproporphyrinogen-3 oxidase
MHGIYIHTPFCARKCFYCDFYSITDISLSNFYIDAIVKEIAFYGDKYKAAPETIFIGGGTPSLLSANQIERIVNSLSKYFDLSKVTEFTIEANPGSADIIALKDYLSLGINRISFGVQSFNNEELKFLQRIHNSEEAITAIKTAQEVGFYNINADLIFSIPGQDANSLFNSIKILAELEIPHISAYSLIYEEDTGLFDAFLKGEIAPVGEEEDADIYLALIDEIASYGYRQYEISNFAIQDRECLHNLNYWRRNEYFGFGPSAHGYLNGIRYNNFADLNNYIKLINSGELPIKSTEELTRSEEIMEIFYLGLRAEGLDLALLKSKYNIDLFEDKAPIIKRMVNGKLADIINNKLILTPEGYALCDNIAVSLSENY